MENYKFEGVKLELGVSGYMNILILNTYPARSSSLRDNGTGNTLILQQAYTTGTYALSYQHLCIILPQYSCYQHPCIIPTLHLHYRWFCIIPTPDLCLQHLCIISTLQLHYQHLICDAISAYARGYYPCLCHKEMKILQGIYSKWGCPYSQKLLVLI